MKGFLKRSYHLAGQILILLILPLIVGVSCHADRRVISLDANWRWAPEQGIRLIHTVNLTRWQWKPTDNPVYVTSTIANQAGWMSAPSGADVFKGKAGYAWFKTSLPSMRFPNRVIHFDNVDDNATVYLNGHLLAKHEGFAQPFDVPLDKAWDPHGPNELVVLVQNLSGPGGIRGSVILGAIRNLALAKNNPFQPNFNDKHWKVVQLPDDYIIRGRISHSANGSHGFLPVYPAWYRKTFQIPMAYKGKTVRLHFGGVYRDAKVYLNGHFLGEHPGGYNAFRFDISHWLHYGGRNVLAVRVDPTFFEGWFYEGGGIYRHVRLIVTNRLHIASWGVFVNPSVTGAIHWNDSTGASANANLSIQTTVRNNGYQTKRFVIISKVYDPRGRVVKELRSVQSLPAFQKRTYTQKTDIANAMLWSLNHTNLYHLHTILESAGRIADRHSVEFGIRKLTFDANRGFLLNGKHVMLQGTCNHQDIAGIGIGVPDNLWAWRIKKLKQLGCNAYRTAHNPLPDAFYRAADRLGMLVMDENRHVGDVYTPKTPLGAPYSKLTDLRTMIMQHRNFPCIIMWSLCNEEVAIQGAPWGAKVFKAMMKVVRSIDPSRPITNAFAGIQKDFGKGFMEVEDILGSNYLQNYAWLHQKFPAKMIFGSEDTNMYSDRGVVRTNVKAGHINEYGTWMQKGKSELVWGHAPWESWPMVMQNPFVAGEFVWTGFDYHGEPNPIGWPDGSNRTGMMDLAGNPKPCYYYWKSWWTRKPLVYIFPAWNFPKDQVGKPILVQCYSNCDQVKLLLNGVNLGVKSMPKYGYLDWSVPYHPGTLEAEGYINGKHVAHWIVQTTNPPYALKLINETPVLHANGEDVAMISAEVQDNRGRVVPYAGNDILFSVKGEGRIVGVANGDPASHELNDANHRSAFHGLAMVMVRMTNTPGSILITASSHGLKSDTIRIKSNR